MSLLKIGIITEEFDSNNNRYWDPDSVYSGISGAEEAVIYVSQELAARGHKVIVFGNPPSHSPHSSTTANPRYIPVSNLHHFRLDIAIIKCVASMGPVLKKISPKVYFWPHGYKFLNQNEIDSFDGALWLSEWQRDCYIATYPTLKHFKEVFGNGINPNQFLPIRERKNPYSCVYGTNYGWGLNMVLNMWPEIKSNFSKATLDIYYGYSGLPPEREKELRTKIPKLYELDVREHGQVSHIELNHAYHRASFWIFPSSVEPETFCISALRAQYAGAVPIVFSWGALSETVHHGCRCFDFEKFPETLLISLENAEKITLDQRKNMRAFIDKRYTWKIIVDRWLEYFS